MTERLVAGDVAGIYPLLPMQKGMLFHELLSGDARPYFRQAAFRIEGAFDPERCERAWNALAARHEVLRASFEYEHTKHLLQIVRRARPVEFHLLLGDDGAVERYLAEDRARGFDLRRDPLTRIALFRLGESTWEMIWSHPHILLDGWSGSVLLSELAALYAGEELPPAPSYSSYLGWLATRDVRAATEHWTRVLDGYESAATVPRNPERDGHGAAEHAFDLDIAALTVLARRNDVTLSTVVQCLWGVLLARYNDTSDVVFGSVVSGRPAELPDVERLVGLFINTVPLRIRFSDGDTFASLLRQTQHANTRSREHEHLALSAIQDLSPLKQALVDHVIAFENYPEVEDRQSCLSFNVTQLRSIEQSHYPFGIIAIPGPSSLRIAFQYDRAVHSAAQLQRIATHLRTLASQVVANEHALLDDLEILATEERTALDTFSRGEITPIPQPATIVDLWERQVERTPHHLALVSGDERLTYRQLDDRAGEIAQSIGDDTVALHTRRGAFRIAALLGILKAGAACVPISSAFPLDRVAFMIRDSGCRTVIRDDFRPAQHARASRRPRPHDLAYVIYTSGSTGRPKGVQIEHGGFVNMIADQIRTFGVTERDRVVQFASCSFDASMSEIFMALLCGAALVIAPENVIRDDRRFLDLVNREGITVATLPPSYLRALDRAELPLRVLITAGEPPDEHDARHYAARLRYFNAYGPTETSVCATMHEVDPSRPGEIPIGKPVANTRLRVLDRRMRPAPIGVPGEIFVGGSGLARGYANSPELTGEKFVMHDGERWYRTGDLGRWTADGNVSYRGRGDTQVKLRGFRIELSEIEHAARSLPGVHHAIADVRDGKLALYIAGDASRDDVRARLARQLPPHMLPAFIVPIDAVPRTTSGKVDRSALPAPSTGSAGLAPRDEVERVVAEAWREVLHLDAVNLDEPFFDAGGDSLKAILLAGRLRRAGHAVPVPDLLRLQTIAAIAAFLRGDVEDRQSCLSTSTTTRAPLTPIQRWFFDEHARDTLPNLSHTIALEPSLPLAEPPLKAALEAVWQHHDALRLRFPDSETQELSNTPLDLQTIGRSDKPFDLERGPLFRARWSEELLLLQAHHLVVDAVSWRFLLEDLSDAYRQAAAGKAVVLPPKTTSYLDWALALHEYSRDERLLAEAEYWRAVDAIDRDRGVLHYSRAVADSFTIDTPGLGHRSDTDVQAFLLAALARVLRAPTRVQLSMHGRESIAPGIDVSRTAGWFTADFPFLLAPADSLQRVRDGLARVPANGIGYGILKYLARDPRLAPPPRIAVNYLGRIDNTAPGFFKPNDRLSGAGTFERRCDLTIDAALAGARLSVDIRTPADDTALSYALQEQLLSVLHAHTPSAHRERPVAQPVR